MVQLNDDVASWMQEALGTTGPCGMRWDDVVPGHQGRNFKIVYSSFHQLKECHSGQCF